MLIYNKYGWYIVIRPKANNNTNKTWDKAYSEKNKKISNFMLTLLKNSNIMILAMKIKNC